MTKLCSRNISFVLGIAECRGGHSEGAESSMVAKHTLCINLIQYHGKIFLNDKLIMKNLILLLVCLSITQLCKSREMPKINIEKEVSAFIRKIDSLKPEEIKAYIFYIDFKKNSENDSDFIITIKYVFNEIDYCKLIGLNSYFILDSRLILLSTYDLPNGVYLPLLRKRTIHVLADYFKYDGHIKKSIDFHYYIKYQSGVLERGIKGKRDRIIGGVDYNYLYKSILSYSD